MTMLGLAIQWYGKEQTPQAVKLNKLKREEDHVWLPIFDVNFIFNVKNNFLI